MNSTAQDLDRLIRESGLTPEEIADAERSLQEQIQDADMLAGGGLSGQAAKIESLEGWVGHHKDDEWVGLFGWRWQPVSIDVFVEHEYYLGLRGQIYPKIMDLLVKATTGRYVEIVIAGSVGSGKSTCSDLLVAYSLYELSCLRDPQRHYGLIDGSPISILQQSITEAKARKVLFAQISTLIRRSKYFNERFKYDPSIKSALLFPRNIRLEPIAGIETAIIGENCVAAALDESNFMPVIRGSAKIAGGSRDGIYDAALANYNAISRRIRSRFMRRGVCPGRLIITSQSRYPGDFTSRKIEEARTDPSILAVEWALWETNPGKYSSKKFRVAVSSEATKQSKILNEGEKPPHGLKRVIEVPEDFRHDFERDIDGALRELAGISTRTVSPFLVRRDAIMGIIDSSRSHPFSLIESTLRDGLRILRNNLDLDVNAPRGAHLDLGIRHDACGLVIGYVSGMRRVERTPTEVELGEEVDGGIEHEYKADKGSGKWFEMLPVIVIEAMLRIVPPPGDEIMLEDVIKLILKLRYEIGLPIKWVTGDTYQSFAVLQMLKERGIRTGVQSVDKTDAPYNELKSAIYDGRLVAYDYPPLIDELVSLERHENPGRGKPKIDHPDTMMTMGGERVRGSKDLADGLAGMVYLLTRRRETWDVADTGTGLERRPTIDRVSMPRPSIFIEGKKSDEPRREVGVIRISSQKLLI